MSSPPFFKNRGGFTLIEVVVSAALLVMLLLILLKAFEWVCIRSTNAASSVQTHEKVCQALELVRSDLSHAVVRVNANRRLNFQLLQTLDANQKPQLVEVYCATLEPHVASLTQMSFVTHFAYQWNGTQHELYRASQRNTSIVQASDPSGADLAANATRLKDMTLSYASIAPYDWTHHPLMLQAIEVSKTLPLLRYVFAFDLECHTTALDSNQPPQQNWSDPNSLPRYMKLKLAVADGADAATLSQNPSATHLLRHFEMFIPCVFYGVYDNVYAPIQP